MYHVPLTVQCIYGRSDEGGKDGDGKDESELPGAEQVRKWSGDYLGS